LDNIFVFVWERSLRIAGYLSFQRLKDTLVARDIIQDLQTRKFPVFPASPSPKTFSKTVYWEFLASVEGCGDENMINSHSGPAATHWSAFWSPKHIIK
jgi:hypothetical protein